MPEASRLARDSGNITPGMEQELAPGQLVAGKYIVERLLGQGGMGQVVQARHAQLAQRVAIKVLHPSAQGNAETHARFLREARTAATLSSEYIARVFDVGLLPSGSPFMVMEHLDGVDLAEILATRGPLPVVEVIDDIAQACVGLAEAHAAGIVHRDLKPSNLFLVQQTDGSTRIKILDFGVAKAPETVGPRITQIHAAHAAPVSASSPLHTATAGTLGSPHYMAPEQFESARDVDARADIWALGVILYQLLTNRLPFEADSFDALFVRIASGPPLPLRALRPDVPPGLEALVQACLSLDRQLRPQNVAQLCAALTPFGSAWSFTLAQRTERYLGAPVSLPRPPAAPPPRALNPWKVALLSMSALVAAGLFVFFLIFASVVSSCYRFFGPAPVEKRAPLPPGDMTNVDLVDLLPQARKLASEIEPGARLSGISSNESKAGAVNVTRDQSIWYYFEYGPSPGWGGPRAGTLAINASRGGLAAYRRDDAPKLVELPDPRCGSRQSWQAAIAGGLPSSLEIRYFSYALDTSQTQRPRWLITPGNAPPRSVDPETCTLLPASAAPSASSAPTPAGASPPDPSPSSSSTPRIRR